MAGREIVLDTKAFLVSETDTKGIIRFANDEFIKGAKTKLAGLISEQKSFMSS